MSKMISRSVVPIGTSMRPELLTLPVRAKTFVPFVVAVPILENQSAPLLMMTGMFASVSTLLMTVGRPQRPLTAGNGGRGLGMPRLPSIDWRSAVSSPQTNAPAPKRSSMSNFMRLANRDLEAVNGERVLRADVDEALRGADRVARDRHRLEDRVGVALKSGAVHVRARVALVGVADHVLLALGLLLGELPLHACREARAAAAAKPGLEHFVDDLLGRHLEEHLLDRLVAVARDVVLDLLGVDHAAVAEHDAVLLLVERDVRLGDELLRLLGVVAEALDDAALDEVLRDDLLDVLGLDLHVEGALRQDLDDRALLAEAEAAGGDHLDRLVELLLREDALELRDNLVAAAGAARGAAADQDV